MSTTMMWQEFEYTKLLQSIPKNFQIGLKNIPLLLTCIDSYKDHILLGTNAGLIYMLYLPTLNIIRLYLKATQSPVTCISKCTSVCDVVACGQSIGSISVIMLAKKANVCQPLNDAGTSKLPGVSVPKLFTLTDLHKSHVTDLCWNTGGTHLFTGDELGNICHIVINYTAVNCTGTWIHKMDTKIVQLTFSPNLLAASSTTQCIIYNLEKQSASAVGKHYMRKQPGHFGCIFLRLGSTAPLFCARSVQRLWAVNYEGEVQWTFINIEHTKQNTSSNCCKMPTFGTLYYINESTLLSRADSNIYLFDLSLQKIISQFSFSCGIVAVSVSDDVIFVLLDNCQLKCLSKIKPSLDYQLLSGVNNHDSSMSDLSSLTSKMLTETTSNLSRLGEEFSQSLIKKSRDLFIKKPTSEDESAEEQIPVKEPSQMNGCDNITEANEEEAYCDIYSGVVVPKSNDNKTRRKQLKETQRKVDEQCTINDLNLFKENDTKEDNVKENRTIEDNQKIALEEQSNSDNNVSETVQDKDQLEGLAMEDVTKILADEETSIFAVNDKNMDSCGQVSAESNQSHQTKQAEFVLKVDRTSLPGDWNKYIFSTRVEKAINYKGLVAFYDNNKVYLPSEEVQYRSITFDSQITGLFYNPNPPLLLVNLSGKVFKVLGDVVSELVADGVKTASLDGSNIWILKLNNQAWVFPDSLTLLPIQIDTNIHLSKIVSEQGVVWALTTDGKVYYRIGMSISATGIEWVLMQGDTQTIVDIHLSINGLGWKVDHLGRIFTLPFVSQNYPQGMDAKWWQVNFCEYLLVNGGKRLSVTSDNEKLWLIEEGEISAYTHSIRYFTAYRWEVYTDDCFNSVYAGGCYGKHGALYCLNNSRKLFVINRKTRSIIPIESPKNEDISSVACRCEMLWVLTTSGSIFVRGGLSGSRFIGSHWIQLDQSDIGKYKIAAISLSSEIVWALDSNGKAYIRLGAASVSIRGNNYPWLKVDDLPDVQFNKISVGSLCHMVWAIDSNSRLYAREAVYGDVPIGAAWVLLEGILASDVSVSESKVFVRTVNGQVFERIGVNALQGNYIGDSWIKLPSGLMKIAALSASTDNVLYGLNEEGLIIKQEVLNLFDVQKSEVPTQAEELDSDDYEMI